MQYELSQEADKDLEDIFDYTVTNFGIEQAVMYVSAFEQTFENLCNNPMLGRERNEIRTELAAL